MWGRTMPKHRAQQHHQCDDNRRCEWSDVTEKYPWSVNATPPGVGSHPPHWTTDQHRRIPRGAGLGCAGRKAMTPDVAATLKEIDVLRLIAAGNANKEIAAQLSITEK